MSEQAVVDARPQAGRSFFFDSSLAQEKSGLVTLFAKLPAEAQALWVDIRDDRSWWAKGVDFMLVGGAKVDFKVEKQKVRNCAAELIKADRPSMRPGWLLTSESHWIVHYFEQTGEVVCLPTRGYRDLVLALCRSGDLQDSVSAANFDRDDKTKLLYMSWNALLPMRTALAKIPGAFWCKLPGDYDYSTLSEARDGLAVPLEWFSLWLQASAQDPLPVQEAKAMMPELYGLLRPYDRAKKANAPRYVAA